MPVKFDDKTDEVIAEIKRKIVITATDVAKAILQRAINNAPFDKGTLVSSGRQTWNGRQAVVSFSTAYAVRRHYENYKNPGTRYYLQRAGEEVANDINQYISKV